MLLLRYIWHFLNQPIIPELSHVRPHPAKKTSCWQINSIKSLKELSRHKPTSMSFQ